MGFGWRHGDSSYVIGGTKWEMCIVDVIYQQNAMCVAILLCVSIVLITVTRLCDKIICLSMCEGWTHHAQVLESKSRCTTATNFDFCSPITVKWESNSYIIDEMYYQNFSEWCHRSHRMSGECSIQICLTDDRHAAFIYASNCITLCSDLVHKVEKFKLAYGTSWKSRRRSWMRKGEEVELYLQKTSEMIYMP